MTATHCECGHFWTQRYGCQKHQCDCVHIDATHRFDKATRLANGAVVAVRSTSKENGEGHQSVNNFAAVGDTDRRRRQADDGTLPGLHGHGPDPAVQQLRHDMLVLQRARQGRPVSDQGTSGPLGVATMTCKECGATMSYQVDGVWMSRDEINGLRYAPKVIRRVMNHSAKCPHYLDSDRYTDPARRD